MKEKDNGAGFISYDWTDAPDGVIDALSGGTALLGLDEAVRFFNKRQNPGLSSANYEIPVKTCEGSWLVVVLGLLTVPAAAFATGYAKKAGEKMAERDFSELGMRDVAAKSMDALVKLVNLIKHLKGEVNWNSLKVKWKKNASLAIITNDEGADIEIPSEYLKWYKSLPHNTLKRLTHPVNKERTLTIGARQKNGQYDVAEVDMESKKIVSEEDEDLPEDEFLFPNLKHSHDFTLEGLITRGNQSTNSIGFQYRGHILNCIPETGSVTKFKPAMFLQCRVSGTVNRHVRSLKVLDHRPTLLISNVIILEDEDRKQENLF
jgi:hypothetical protein